MAKSRPKPKPEKSIDFVVYAVGAVIVIALLVFSFTRIARKPEPSVAAIAEQNVPQAVPTETVPGSAQSTAPSTALPAVASPRAGDVAAPPAVAQPPIQPVAPTQAQLASVPRVSVAQLSLMMEQKNVTIIDVRDAESFTARHITGALHIPLAYIAGEVAYLPKDKPIVTYCT